MIRDTAACVLSLVLAFGSPAVFAWGDEGHAIVAQIAEANLTPAARREVARLLAVEPGATMESVASWADQVRNGSTARWHFVNFDRGDCTYRPQRQCPGGECIVDALAREERVLADTAAGDAAREVALKYVIHLVGDAHQPLHAGAFDDRGGNRYQIYFDGRGSNLHAFWDSGMIRALGIDQPGFRAGLIQLSQRAGSNDDVIDPVTWVERSCRIAQSPWMYPPRRVPDAYLLRAQPYIDSQLIAAGQHLADVLNRVLAGGR